MSIVHRLHTFITELNSKMSQTPTYILYDIYYDKNFILLDSVASTYMLVSLGFHFFMSFLYVSLPFFIMRSVSRIATLS